MKLPVLTFALASVALFSCERTTDKTTTTKTDRNDTITVTRTEGRTTTEDNLNDFRQWVNEKTSKGDSAARKEWPEIKEDFRKRTAELDRNMDSLSAESKAEYNELRAKYEKWEADKEKRGDTPLDPAKIKQLETELLGSNSNYTTITPDNIKEVYVNFMQRLRGKKDKLSAGDWDYVDHVYSKLNSRKGEMESKIATSDKLKITGLQTEYLTLEAAGDVKDLSNTNRK